MSKKLFLAGALVTVGTISGTWTSEAQSAPLSFKWMPEKAIIGGECGAPGEVQVIASGPDLSILFRSLRVRLEKGVGGLLASRLCSVRVPLTVPALAQRATVTQTVTCSVDKGAFSTGEIKTLGAFLDQPGLPFSIGIPKGPMHKLLVAHKLGTVVLDTCGGHAKDGLFKGDVALSVRRNNVNEAILLGAGATQAIDLRYDITSNIAPCFG